MNDPYCYDSPMGTSGVFNEGIVGYNRIFQEVPDYFCVFREWTDSVRIRLKFEISETAGTIYLSGNYNGAPVWNLNTASWEQREAVPFVGTTTVTSTKYFDAKGFKLVKPVTTGRVSAYALTDDGTETLVAVYDPSETAPRWRRYRVPCLPSESDYMYACIVRAAYVPLVNSYDEVIPGNIAALRLGLSALLEEDARNYDAADVLWEKARERLVRQSESESEGTEDHVAISDDFGMATLGTGL